jgi:hypothetical protein
MKDIVADILLKQSIKLIVDMANKNITSNLEVDDHTDIEVTAYHVKGRSNPVYKYKEALRVASSDIIDEYINELYPGGGEKIQNT